MAKPIEVEARTKAYAVIYGWGPVKGSHPFIGAHYFMRGMPRDWDLMSVALFPRHIDAVKAWKKARKKNPKSEIVLVDVFVKRVRKE